MPWKAGSILCIGCGDGFEVALLHQRGLYPVGITNDERELGHNPDVVLMDMHDLQIEDGYFDYVYSKEALEHTPAPYVALEESARVLKPGGEFFHLISVSMEKQREIYHFSCFPDFIWYDLFKKAGLKVGRIYEHPQQLGFYGHKEEPDWGGRFSYDLNGELNGVPREPLIL